MRCKIAGQPVGTVAFAPAGKTLAATCGEYDYEEFKVKTGRVVLWDVPEGK